MAVDIIEDNQIYAGVRYRFVYDEKTRRCRIQLLDGAYEQKLRAQGVSFAAFQNLNRDCDHEQVVGNWIQKLPK